MKGLMIEKKQSHTHAWEIGSQAKEATDQQMGINKG